MNAPGRAACSIGLVAALLWGGAQAQASLGEVARVRYERTILELLGEPSGRAFLEVFRAIDGEYLGEADRAALLEGALRGLVAALDDPYVRYLDVKDLITEAAARRDPDVIATATLGDLGYLRVRSFDSERAGERFGTELDELLVRGVRGLVLDLRGNDGGLVLTGLQVLDRLLPDGVLGYRSSAQGPLPLGFANPRATALPVAVLVDGGTASTAEIVAGALQTYGRARLYGAITAGKGVGQTSLALPNGGELRLVTFAWTLPDGRSIDGWGLTPDVPVRPSAASGTPPAEDLDLADVAADAERDPTLAAALVGLRAALGDDLTAVEPRPIEAPPEPTGSEGTP